MGKLALAAGAAAAGYYFYASKDAKKNRKIAALWASNFRKDVTTQAKKLRTVDQQTFLNLVNSSVKTYKTARNIDPRELERAAKELRSNWKAALADMRKGTRKATKTIKKATRKAASTA